MDEFRTWADVAERLASLPRGTPYQLALALEMNTSYFYRLVNEKKGKLTVDRAKVINEFFENLDHGSALEPAAFAAPATPGIIKLPMFGYAAASDGERIAMNEGDILEWYELPHGLVLDPVNHFVLRTLGSSMEPRIFGGEPVVVRRKYPPARDQDAVIEFNDGSGLIKTYQGQRAGRVFAKQWNEEKVLDFDAASVKALHAVIMRL